MSKPLKKPTARHWQWAIFYAFLILVTSVGLYALVATSQLSRRSGVQEYLQADNIWDNCNDNTNRKFFIATSEVIELSLDPTATEADLREAGTRLSTARTRMDTVETVDVCGPPPRPPAAKDN